MTENRLIIYYLFQQTYCNMAAAFITNTYLRITQLLQCLNLRDLVVKYLISFNENRRQLSRLQSGAVLLCHDGL